MAKLGSQYEAALGELLRCFDSSSIISVGKWVPGPYGSRDIDVLLEGRLKDQKIRIAFECKDYNRKRKIGIGTVDAFCGKLPQLGVDFGIICSNAGFSKQACQMAASKKIGLIGILKEDSSRSFDVYDYIESRWAKVVNNGEANFEASGKSAALFLEDKVGEDSLESIAQKIFRAGVIRYGAVSGKPTFEYTLAEPVPITGSDKFLLKVRISCEIVGMIMGKLCRVSGHQGIYNWLSRTLLAPTAGGGYVYHGVPLSEIKNYREFALLEYIPETTSAPGVLLNTICLESFADPARPLNIGSDHRIDPFKIKLLSDDICTKKSSPKSRVQKWIGRPVPRNR